MRIYPPITFTCHCWLVELSEDVLAVTVGFVGLIAVPVVTLLLTY